MAYVLVPPGATAKTLAAEFARYLGIPVTARMTQAQITEAVCHTYNRAGVRLVLIDENPPPQPGRTTTGAETADLLKDLTERIGATFGYAGIDVTATALFSGVRGAQLAGRASLVECGAFPARLGTRKPFKELIAGVKPAPPSRHHCDRRRHRTQHQNQPRPDPHRPPRRNTPTSQHRNQVPLTPAIDTPGACSHAKPCDLRKHGPGL
ncbi:TniB family NTP-binding protein [Embleya scabrispora]|uniref:TniB family NTP-binding protein n=1 Tax=Embleya scabrispora TaxID=159449 RepID=UPI0039C89F11